MKAVEKFRFKMCRKSAERRFCHDTIGMSNLDFYFLESKHEQVCQTCPDHITVIVYDMVPDDTVSDDIEFEVRNGKRYIKI